MDKRIIQLYENFGRMLPRGVRMILDPIMQSAGSQGGEGKQDQDKKKDKKDKKDKKKKDKE